MEGNTLIDTTHTRESTHDTDWWIWFIWLVYVFSLKWHATCPAARLGQMGRQARHRDKKASFLGWEGGIPGRRKIHHWIQCGVQAKKQWLSEKRRSLAEGVRNFCNTKQLLKEKCCSRMSIGLSDPCEWLVLIVRCFPLKVLQSRCGWQKLPKQHPNGWGGADVETAEAGCSLPSMEMCLSSSLEHSIRSWKYGIHRSMMMLYGWIWHIAKESGLLKAEEDFRSILNQLRQF